MQVIFVHAYQIAQAHLGYPGLVKAILAQHGIPLDTVELQLEARGFVDKPIAFEFNRDKVFDLLIGTHLYGRPDVAVRELVQNAVDSCHVRSSSEPQFVPSIQIVKDSENLTVLDNGIGMGFIEAKDYLSSIGSSYYQSEDFLERVKDHPFDPISSFGIGLLSSFLIADTLEIETKKAGEDACLFTVPALGRDWKYEKGTLKETGTRITLRLNAAGKNLKLADSISHYFLYVDMMLTYMEDSEAPRLVSSKWSKEEAVSRFLGPTDFHTTSTPRVVVEICTPQYDAVLLYAEGYFLKRLVVFNHGIFVTRLEHHLLDGRYCLFLNVKQPCFDLHVSRENVIINEKWFDLIHTVFSDIIRKVVSAGGDECQRGLLAIANIIEDRVMLDPVPREAMLREEPLIRVFYELAPFPRMSEGTLVYGTLAQMLDGQEVTVYRCASEDFLQDVNLVKRACGSTPSFLHPYRLPSVRLKKGSYDSVDLVQYLAESGGCKYREMDLRTVLLQAAEVDDKHHGIAPPNVLFATFGSLKPLVVVQRFPVVSEGSRSLGYAYWGNILLFWRLLDPERRQPYRDALRKSFGDRYESMTLLSEPVVLVDSSDEFISTILKLEGTLGVSHKQNIHKYFEYITFLPFVVGNSDSCIIFIEALESLEKQIAKELAVERPKCIFDRLYPEADLYLTYFHRFGMKYYE